MTLFIYKVCINSLFDKQMFTLFFFSYLMSYRLKTTVFNVFGPLVGVIKKGRRPQL